MRAIMQGSAPVLLVSHDADDRGWQFFGGDIPEMSDAVLVSLQSVVEKDESLYDIADLPPGWYATRVSREAPWTRGQSFEAGQSNEL
jgi:hypothetical protein